MAKLTNAIDILNEINDGQDKIKDLLAAQIKLDKDQEERARREEISRDSRDNRDKKGPGFLSKGASSVKKTFGKATGGGEPDLKGMAMGFGLLGLDKMMSGEVGDWMKDNKLATAAIVTAAAGVTALAAKAGANKVKNAMGLDKDKTYSGRSVVGAEMDDMRQRAIQAQRIEAAKRADALGDAQRAADEQKVRAEKLREADRRMQAARTKQEIKNDKIRADMEEQMRKAQDIKKQQALKVKLANDRMASSKEAQARENARIKADMAEAKSRRLQAIADEKIEAEKAAEAKQVEMAKNQKRIQAIKANAASMESLKQNGYIVNKAGNLQKAKGGAMVSQLEASKAIQQAEQAGDIKSPDTASGVSKFMKVIAGAAKIASPITMGLGAAADAKSRDQGLSFGTRMGMDALAAPASMIDLVTNSTGFAKDFLSSATAPHLRTDNGDGTFTGRRHKGFWTEGWEGANWGQSEWATDFAEQQKDLMRWAVADKNKEIREIQGKRLKLEETIGINGAGTSDIIQNAIAEAQGIEFEERARIHAEIQKLNKQEANIRKQQAEAELRISQWKEAQTRNKEIDNALELIGNMPGGKPQAPVAVINPLGGLNIPPAPAPAPSGGALFAQKLSTLTP